MPDTETTLGAKGAAAPAAAPQLADFDARFHTRVELARGGMGRVLIAEDVALHREVAVKELLLKENPGAARRFEREALLTARLQHPGIVSVYELARRATGEPVLVMRRVQGKPFEEAIAQAGSLEARLALLAPFTSACDAVAYAHRQRVIHRDLKPGNVLLGDFGDTVVIDWGLAKDLSIAPASDEEPPDSAETLPAGFGSDLTIAGSVMGTPSYMAPEQARGEPAGAPSDVYALGAMLYHLLSGARPYLGGDSKQVVAAVRRGPPPPLAGAAPALTPELVTIVERAMAREAQDRYPTAAELSDELKRFQTGRLVLSHSYSTRELVLRWARRHAAPLALSAIFLLLLGAGGALGVRRVVAERDRANREAEVSRRVSDFMIGMFNLSDPSEARGNSATAREILEKAAREIDGGLAQDPLIQAQLMDAIGRVHLALGLYRQSEPLLAKAVEARRHLLGQEHPDTLASLHNLGVDLFEQGRYPEAEKIQREVLERRRRVLGPDHQDTLKAMNNLANTLDQQGRAAEGEELHRTVLEIQRRVLGPDNRDTLASMNNLATLLRDQHRLPEAEKLHREVLEILRRLLGPDHPDVLKSMNNLANTLADQGRQQEAEAILREALGIRRRVLGPEHPGTLLTLYNLASCLSDQGRHAEAEKLDREVLEVRRRVLGPEHPSTLRALGSVANELGEQGHYAEAEQVHRQLLEVRRRLLGPEHPDTQRSLDGLATAVLRQRRPAEAEQLLQELLAIRRRTRSAELASTLVDLGCVAALGGDRARSLGWLEQAVDARPSSELAEQLAKSEDLGSLRGDPAFAALLARAKAGPR